LCGKPLKRRHFTCSFCRKRRYTYGLIHPPEYVRGDFNLIMNYRKNGAYVIPSHATVYYLIINQDRRFGFAKWLISKWLLVILEALSN
jgi:hypothetical protein